MKEVRVLYTFNREHIEDGVSLNTISHLPFKTNRISINCFVELNEKTASAYAMLPFLLKKRTKNIDSLTKMGKALSNLYGASLWAGCRKLGDNQVLTISITSIDDEYSLNHEDITNNACEILLDILLNPCLKDGLFLEEDIEIEKKNLVELIESEFNDKRTYAINRCISLMCKDTPFGLNKYGEIEKIKKLSAQQVTDAYRELIRSSSIQVIAVLKSDQQLLKSKISGAFDKVKRENVYKPILNRFKCDDDFKEETEIQKVNQAKLVLGFSAPTFGIKSDYAMMVFNYLYGGTPTSKLFENVREKLSLCYYCASRYDINKGMIVVDSGVEMENLKRAKEEILKQLNDIKEGKVEKNLLEQTKLSIINSLNTAYDSQSGLENWYLNQISLARKLSPIDAIEKVKQVGLDDIINLSKGVRLCQTYILTGDLK